MTNDVECYSMYANNIDYSIVDEIQTIGIPRLLELYSKHDVKATFYVTGKFAELSPESIDLILSYGHEIGCHSYSHEKKDYLYNLTYEEQVSEIKKSMDILKPIAGNMKAFRAPALRMNEDTVRALEKLGFTTDSSICSQRFDGPFTFGSDRNLKLKWLFARRKPYNLSTHNISKSGTSNVLELPISASVFTFSGNTIRRSNWITNTLTKQLFIEAKKTGKPPVFVFHPHECLDYPSITNKYQMQPFYKIGTKLKYHMKYKNIGMQSIHLLDTILTKASEFGFDFISASDYQKKYIKRADINDNNSKIH